MGREKAGVIRRFVENGVRLAIERRVIEKRDVADFGADLADEEDED
jgi:hypothetical protein